MSAFCQKNEKEKTLADILDKYRGKKQYDYDCALAFSGGKDSTYVLYLLKKKYQMNVLAITGDDYMSSPQSWGNKFGVTKKLGVDHMIIRYNWDLYRKVYRASIVKSGMRPRAINFVHNLMHEKAIYEVLQKNNIPLLVTGNSQSEFDMFKEWEKKLNFKSTGNYSYDYWNNWRNFYIKVLEEILPENLQKRIPEIVWSKPHINDLIAQVRYLPIFKYEKFNVQNNIKIIKKELGWKLPTDVGGTETDSAGLQFDVCIYKKIHGKKAYADQVNKLIKNGIITKEIALKALSCNNNSIIDKFFKDFELSWNMLNPDKCSPLLAKLLDLYLPIR